MEKVRVQVNGRGYYLKSDEPEKIQKIAKEYENQILYIVSKMPGIIEAEATALSALLMLGEASKQNAGEATAEQTALLLDQREKLNEAAETEKQLRGEIDELNGKIRGLDKTAADMQQKLDEAAATESSLRARIDGAQTSDDVTKQQLEEAMTEISELKAVIEADKEAYAELQDKNSKDFTGLLEQEVTALRENESKLKIKLEEANNKSKLLTDELESEKQNEKKLREELEQLKKASEELLRDLEAEDKNKSKDKTMLDAETEAFYKNELLSAKENEVALMDELNALKERENNYTVQVNKAENTASEAKAALCSANKLIAQLNSEKLSQAASIEALRQECDISKQKLEASNRSVAELNGKLTEVNIKNSVNADAGNSTLEVKELKMRNEDLQIELEIANEMIEELKAGGGAPSDEERQKLNEKIAGYEKVINDLKASGGEIDKLRGVLVETEQAIRQKCDEKEEENRKLRGILSNYENSYQICVNQKEEEIRSLQKQLQELMEKYNEKTVDSLDGFVQPTFEA